MRLIDADALREIVEDGLRNNPHKDGFSRVCHQTEYTHFLDVICKMPTITPPPNDPLTLEELREMDGEPVWVEGLVKGIKSHWGIVHGNYISDGKLPNEKGKCLLLIGDTGGYDITWLAYRRKKEQHERYPHEALGSPLHPGKP